MKQINVETATREQLVSFIRRMHPQLQREQERVKELESQISGFQEFIHEKNAEIRVLRQQSDRLTEKSASDEETIGALIKQMEEMRLEQVPSPPAITAASSSGPSAPRSKTGEQGAGKGHPPGEGAGGERSPEALRPVDAPGNGDFGRRPSRTPPAHKDSLESTVASLKAQNATAASAIANKADEIARLESKVRELMEVNAFYSAIVAQHDQEEKARMGQKLVRGSEQSEEDVAELRQELERLQLNISDLDVQEEKLQRIIRATEAEKSALRQENELLKRASVQLEAEMEEMTREYTRARRSLAATVSRHTSIAGVRLMYADDEPLHSRAGSAPQEGPTRDGSLRGAISAPDSFAPLMERRLTSVSSSAAPRVSPLSYEGRQGALAAGRTSSASVATSSSASRSMFNFRSLRPIRVRNPDAHEKDLLDRIRLYEQQLAQVELFEADRQRSFDEMEHNRAEMFAAMNAQLEKQRKEIHRLRKLHEEASLDSSLTARPSHNHSVASVANREEEEGRVNMRHHGSHSPEDRCLTAVPTSTQSLLNVESLNAIDDAEGSFSERDTVTTRSGHQRRGTASSAPAGAPGWQEELRRREREGRVALWWEAVEGSLELFSLYHAVAVQQFTEELAACHAKLLGEREELTLDLETLQRRNEELESQVECLESVLQARAEEAEADGKVAASAEVADLGSAAAHDSTAVFLEDKALCAAHLALDAYGVVLSHYAELLRWRGGGDLHETKVDTGDDGLEGEVASDLAELRAVLDSLLHPRSEALHCCEAPPLSSPLFHVEADVLHTLPASGKTAVVADESEPSHSDDSALCSSPSSSSALSSLRDGPAVITAEEGECGTPVAPSSSSTSSETGKERMATSPDLSAGDAAGAATSLRGSQSGCLHPEALRSGERESVPSSGDSATTTEYERLDGPEDGAFAQVSADEADGTPTSRFADCVEKDDGTGFSSASPEAEEEDTAARNDALFAERSTPEGTAREESCGETSRASLTHPPESSLLHGETQHLAESTAEPQGASGAALDQDAVELCDSADSDLTNAESQLDVTAAEEAELLAQLQEEMAKAETSAPADTGEAGEPHAASANTPSSSVRSDDDAAEAMTPAESPIFENRGGSEGQPAVEAVSGASSTSTKGGETEDMGVTAVDNGAVGRNSACSSASGSEDTHAFSNEEAIGRHEDSLHSGKDEELLEGAPAQQLAHLSPNASTTSLSPNKSAKVNPQRAEGVAARTTDGFAVATSFPPPGVSASMIPPASLDELFGGHPGSVSHSPLPEDAAQNVVAVPVVSSIAVQQPSPPLHSQKPTGPPSPLNSYHAVIPTLSPNSMFATPPRQAAFRSYITPSLYPASALPLHSDRKEAHSRASSSSSNDEFEAGFDPFA